MRTGLILALLLLLGGWYSPAVQAQSHTCPIDNSSMWNTGQVDVGIGGTRFLYQCPFNHQFWVSTQPSAPRPPSLGPVCPSCGMSVYFTGRTFVEVGRLFRIYRCPSGHESFGQ